MFSYVHPYDGLVNPAIRLFIGGLNSNCSNTLLSPRTLFSYTLLRRESLGTGGLSGGNVLVHKTCERTCSERSDRAVSCVLTSQSWPELIQHFRRKILALDLSVIICCFSSYTRFTMLAPNNVAQGTIWFPDINM